MEQRSAEKTKKKATMEKLHKILTTEKTEHPEFVTNNFTVPTVVECDDE